LCAKIHCTLHEHNAHSRAACAQLFRSLCAPSRLALGIPSIQSSRGTGKWRGYVRRWAACSEARQPSGAPLRMPTTTLPILITQFRLCRAQSAAAPRGSCARNAFCPGRPHHCRSRLVRSLLAAAATNTLTIGERRHGARPTGWGRRRPGAAPSVAPHRVDVKPTHSRDSFDCAARLGRPTRALPFYTARVILGA
jgi:hypothetical protein